MQLSEYENMTTIIIPSRSYDFLLEKTIKKIREQYKLIRIIIILDNPVSANNIKESNITILKSEFYTMSAKRNQGVMHANTKYIALLDSDAYPCQNWLQTGIDFLENSPEYCAVTGIWYNQEDDDFDQQCVRIHRFLPIFSRKGFHKMLDAKAKDQDVNDFAAANIIIKRESYINTGGMDPHIYVDEDIEFAERLIGNGYKIRFIPNVAVFHRESHILQYMKKTYGAGIVCANEIYRNKYFQKTAFWHLYPLGLVVLMILMAIFLFIKKISLFWLLLPISVCLFVIILDCYASSVKYSKYKIKCTFKLVYISILFSFIYVFSLFVGLLNIKINPQDFFKQY